jgi:hypothetical protein
MRSRALTLVLMVAAGVLSAPSRLAADKPPLQTYSGGVLGLLADCPEAQLAILSYCLRQPERYVVFKGKGVKRFMGVQVVIQGLPLPTACGLPGVELKKITADDSPPSGCP